MIDKGKRVVMKCLECDGIQLGWSSVDGVPCNECSGALEARWYHTETVEGIRVIPPH